MKKFTKTDIELMILLLGIFLAISFGEVISWAFRVWWDNDSLIFPAIHVSSVLITLTLILILFNKKDMFQE